MIEFTPKEEKIMFHTLGYDYQPHWNDDKGGYRNWFGTHSNTVDYQVIQKLIEKGYMQKDGDTAWNEEVFSVTDIGKDYVVDLWLKKKKENKPSRSKRRYQAYLDWCDWWGGTFYEFLGWLQITKDRELFCEKECETVREFKRRWQI